MEKIKIAPNEADEIIVSVEKILSRGNSAQIKKRKNDIIVLEEQRKIDVSISKSGCSK